MYFWVLSQLVCHPEQEFYCQIGQLKNQWHTKGPHPCLCPEHIICSHWIAHVLLMQWCRVQWPESESCIWHDQFEMTSLLDYAYPMNTHSYKHLYVLFRADIYWLMEVFCFVYFFLHFLSAQVLCCLCKLWRLVTSPLSCIIVHYFSQDKCKSFINEYMRSCLELIKYERTFQAVNIPVLLLFQTVVQSI